MKINYLFAVLLFCCGSVSAQNVEGYIYNANTNEPLENVLVKQASASQGIRSLNDGSFTLEVEDFPVRLHFSAENYETRSLRLEGPDDDLRVYLFPSSEALSEVVLRSTIIPQKLLKTPASVNVISEADIERTDETNIVETINRVPGVYVHQGALNTNKLNIRGIGSRSQYSTNRVKAYFMEIPISTAEGQTTLDDIDPSVLERAEIIKGPSSSVYGAGLGGVISLYAADAPEEGTTAKVKGTYGSYELFKGTARVAHASGNTNLNATYNRLETQSFRDNGEYLRNSITLHGQIAANDKNSLSILAQATRLKAYIPSSVDRETLENDPSSAAFTWGAARGYESYDKALLGLSYRHDFSDGFYNTTSVYTNFRDAYEPRPFDILSEDQSAVGGRTKFNLMTETFGAPSELSFGAEYYREWYDIKNFENLYQEVEDADGSVEGSLISNNSQDRSYYNIFAQYNIELHERLDLEAGLNVNSTRYELDDLFEQDNIDQSGNYRFETIVSPRIGAVFSIAEGKNFYATVSHGFSTPTVAETLTPEGLINTSLEPETGINYEAGFKANFFDNKLYAEVTAYSIQVENLLVAERVGEDQYIGRNAGQTDHNGIEFLVNYNFPVSSWLRIRSYVNGSFNDFQFDDFVDDGDNFSGNHLPAVPDKSLHAGLDFLTEHGISLFASYQHEGEMPLNDENSLYTESYNLIRLKASLEPLEFWSSDALSDWEINLFGGVNNLTDENYAASIVPNAVGFGGSSPRYFYPGNPRNYFVGASVSYLF